ncbi:MAG: hypothetical protein K8F91_04235 [Candidatus Obscuribacterales bacterium]|nr:hypothetical protein [Candidatus Obscuribacterales bacterium]
MRKQDIVWLICSLLACVFFYAQGYAQAYDQTVVNNLSKTRDALLDQRSHLDVKADEIKKKIDELSRQLNLVNTYLTDTDKSLRDIEDAIRRVK